ncbi:uncharacterized protein BXZ73DRAFT_99045 [Epithele typhae]|uniref:uncharacterized protein n=1 Tax=Epithele typhae TaxID=378194 RepID=UPI0020072039|nr:uncharacterized protein BXZ73DRAFT_99045 [Epithele typhae]KAH9940051.1 hypothetical protein BXZ73DRAFT_99045 [Epithele typhae]
MMHSETTASVSSAHRADAKYWLIWCCSAPARPSWLLRDVFPQSVVADGLDKALARVRHTIQRPEPVPESELPTAAPDLSVLFLATTSTSAGPSSTEHSPAHVPSTGTSEPATASDASETWSQAEEAQLEIGEVAARNAIRPIKRAERQQRAEAEIASREDVYLVWQDGEGEKEEAEANEERTEEDFALENSTPGTPAIKGPSVCLSYHSSRVLYLLYQHQGVIGTRDQEQANLDTHMMWRYFGYEVKRGDLEVDGPDEEIPGAARRLVYTTKDVTA